MANVKIRNTREHDIHLNLPGKPPVVIPAARQNPEDATKLIHGQAMVDSEVLEVLEGNPVVDHYFAEGWLQEVKAPAPKEPKDKK